MILFKKTCCSTTENPAANIERIIAGEPAETITTMHKNKNMIDLMGGVINKISFGGINAPDVILERFTKI